MIVGPIGDKKSVSYDMVYVPAALAGTTEYRNAHIDIKVIGDKFEIMITAETDIEKRDLEILVNKVQLGVFSKMKTNIAEDCAVLLNAGGAVREILVAGGPDELVIKES